MANPGFKRYHRKIRQRRIRKKLTGTAQLPRLAVFRSNKHIYAQVIDDTKNMTLIAMSDIANSKKDEKTTKIQIASQVGENLAKAVIKKNIKKVVFDRSGYKFHGRIKALAEGAQKGGLIF